MMSILSINYINQLIKFKNDKNIIQDISFKEASSLICNSQIQSLIKRFVVVL